MKKLFICLAATAAVCSAQAQSGDFTGFSAGGNLAMNAGGASETNGTSTIDGFGQQSLGVGGFVGYGLSMGSASIITFGFDYSFVLPRVFPIKLEFPDGLSFAFCGEGGHIIGLGGKHGGDAGDRTHGRSFGRGERHLS